MRLHTVATAAHLDALPEHCSAVQRKVGRRVAVRHLVEQCGVLREVRAAEARHVVAHEEAEYGRDRLAHLRTRERAIVKAKTVDVQRLYETAPIKMRVNVCYHAKGAAAEALRLDVKLVAVKSTQRVMLQQHTTHTHARARTRRCAPRTRRS